MLNWHSQKVNKFLKVNTLVYLMLITSIASIFFLQNHKIGFENGHHGFLSSHGAAIAKNTSYGHNFLMFHAIQYKSDGNLVYEPYNRFPIFPFAIIKFTMSFFEPDLAKQVYYARQLMNIFLSLSILVTFLIIHKLYDDHYKAICLTLLSFSSYYILFYGDMIFNDIPSLFGFVIAFLIVFYWSCQPRNGYFLSLLVIPSISMGWQPLAVYFSWFSFEGIVSLINKFRNSKNSKNQNFRLLSSSVALLVAVSWALLILSLQLLNEWQMVGGSFGDIPTVKSMMGRVGLSSGPNYSQYKDLLFWPNFLLGQGIRIGTSIVPLYLKEIMVETLGSVVYYSIFVVFCFISCTGIIRMVKGKSYEVRLLFFIMASSGILWNFLMRRHTAFHGFQSIFYIGIAVLFHSGISYFIKNSWFKYLTPLVVVFFIVSVYEINGLKDNLSKRVNPITYEYQSIYGKLPKGSKIYIDGDKAEFGIGYHAVDFYLAGNYFSLLADADYVISKNNSYNARKITNNDEINLFRK